MSGAARWLLHCLALCCLLAASPLHALGVGEISLHSALNQPLHAEVALLMGSDEQLDDVTARLADADAYARAGLVRAGFLSKLSFHAERNAAGQAVIRISSRESVREPVLELLLDVRWHYGHLLRQYALLLDPPTQFVAPQSSPAAVPAPVPQASAAAKAQKPTPAVSRGSYGPVQRGEILGEIARRLKPAGVSTEQMTVALYKANPHAFLEGNINRLRWGTTLFMPSEDSMHEMTRGQAGRFIQGQYDDWRGPDVAVVEAVPAPAVVQEQPTPTGAAAPAQLQILAPTPSPADAVVDELQQRLVEVHRINQAVQAENEALRAKLAELEEQTRRLAEQVLAAAPEAAAEAGVKVELAPDAEPQAESKPQAIPPARWELVGDVPPGMRLDGTQPPTPSWWRDPFWGMVALALLLGLGGLALGSYLWRRYRDVHYRGFEQALREDEAAKARARHIAEQMRRQFGE